MNKRKFWGIVLVIIGMIMVVGSMGYEGAYKAMAPISMSLIVIAGFVVIFWDTVKGWFSK